jgi:hypothetical protein
MENTISRRPIAAVIALAAAVIMLIPSATAPPVAVSSGPPAPRVAAQTVALTANPLEQLWDIATGADSSYPLPAGVNPIAPIAEQIGLNATIYVEQLLTGHADAIPAEVTKQMTELGKAAPVVGELLVRAVQVVPVVVGGAAVFTAFTIGAIVTTLQLPKELVVNLPRVWLMAPLVIAFNWLYIGFAIRNVVAVALQPPISEPASAAATASTEPVQRRATSGRAVAKAATTPPAKRVTPPTSKRSAKPAAASSTTTRAKSGVAGAQRQR